MSFKSYALGSFVVPVCAKLINILRSSEVRSLSVSCLGRSAKRLKAAGIAQILRYKVLKGLMVYCEGV